MSQMGIIGGTGLSQLEGLQVERCQVVPTPWGEPSAPLMHGVLAGCRAVFLPRHGSRQDIAPHQVNYRANIWALHEVGVERVVAINAVGGIGAEFPPGALAIPHQLIDYSWGRAHTFFEGADRPLMYVDFTTPYTQAIRRMLLDAAGQAGLAALDGGVYGVTQGPRLETAAEIDRMARDGCDLVGMTGMPEAALARELGLQYASCAVVVNRAAGRGEDIHGELGRWLQEGMDAVRRLLEALFAGLDQP